MKDHIALDECGVYIQKKHITEDIEHKYLSLFSYMTSIVDGIPAGSGRCYIHSLASRQPLPV